MPIIPPITDAYIDEIIKAPDAYNPTLNKTQGIKLRELIKLMRDKMQSNSAGEDSEVVINEYNSSKSYAIGDVVYITDEYRNRILYQSIINNNVNTFYSGGLSIPNVEFGFPAPIPGLGGIILPFQLYGYEYDANLSFTYKSYYLENNEYKQYDAFTVKLKKEDGRRFGFYFSQPTQIFGLPPAPALDYVTIKIKTSNDESENTEVVVEKSMAEAMRFYYETPAGLRLKIKLDTSVSEQIIDISGIIAGWYLLGYPEFKLDTSGFIDNSDQPQTKAGPLQLNSNFSNKQKRVLYSVNPYNQRDTQNGYIEEITEQYDIDGEQVGNFVVLGNHFSEGYFTNSIDIAVTSYNGSINKKWTLFSDTIRGGNWFTVLPVNEGVQYNGGGDVDLEVKYVYPYGYWFRLRVKAAGGIGGIALYTKSYQGTFYKWNISSENIIGPVTGNDISPTDDMIGDKGHAKTLKVYSAPVEDNDVVRLKDLNDYGGNPLAKQYIEASPSIPQDANINLNGTISTKQVVTEKVTSNNSQGLLIVEGPGAVRISENPLNVDSSFSIQIGGGADAGTGSPHAIAIGQTSSTRNHDSIVIGRDSFSNRNYQFVAGSWGGNGTPIQEVYFNTPEQNAGSPANYQTIGYRIRSQSIIDGTDSIAGSIGISLGEGTGAGSNARFFVETPDAVESGDTLQTVSEKFAIEQDGRIKINKAPQVSSSDYSILTRDNTTGEIKQLNSGTLPSAPYTGMILKSLPNNEVEWQFAPVTGRAYFSSDGIKSEYTINVNNYFPYGEISPFFIMATVELSDIIPHAISYTRTSITLKFSMPLPASNSNSVSFILDQWGQGID